MKLYARSGVLVRFLKTEREAQQFGPPVSFDEVLEFDGATNEDVVQGLDTDWNQHSLVGGVLYRDSVPITINAPSEDHKDREALRTFWANLNAAIDFLDNAISDWPGMTGVEKQAWLAAHFDKVLRSIHGALRFIRWLVRSRWKLSGL